MRAQPTTTGLLDAQGRQVSRDIGVDRACPRCRGAKRVASGGFGQPYTVCATCGFEWPDQPFLAEEH